MMPDPAVQTPSTRTNVQHYWDPAIVDRYRSRQAQGLSPVERDTIERYFTRRAGPILDLGCGTGRTTTALHHRGFDVHGVDISRPLIREARRACPAATFTVGDATRLPFTDETFTGVLFSYNGLDELYPESARRTALEEIHRVLTPAGRFVFSTRNWWRYLVLYPVSVDQLHETLEFWREFVGRISWTSPFVLETSTDRRSLVHYTCPVTQKTQLKACGFDPLQVIGSPKWGSVSQYFAPSLHYVAAKESA